MNAPERAALADPAALQAEVARLERRLRRETAARLEAEAIAERGLRDLFQRQQHIALLERIAAAANRADGVGDAMSNALEAICLYSGWPLGHLWLAAEPAAGPRLDPSGIWYDAGDAGCAEPVRALRLRTQASRFGPGEGMPGQVFERRAPASLDLDGDVPEACTRLAHARGAGFASLFAAPVLIGDEVVAVLEFFSRERIDGSESLLSLMAQIGTQLGRVIERRRAQDKLVHDALHDPLTQLGNRKLFLDRVSHLLRRAQRTHAEHFAVLFVDLDRFKSVNDGLGHHAGDELIIATARRLQAALRQTDRVMRDPDGSREQLVARLGGDEFVILLDRVATAGQAIVVAERIIGVLAAPFDVGGQRVFMTASVGIALSASGYADVEDILRDADIAMYHAKQTGRARWVMFDQAMQLAAVRRLMLEADLRGAIEERQFFLNFQPIVTPADGRVRGFEALLRWRHPVHGVVAPGEFIPVVEETGLIEPIGAWVLDEACRQLRQWQDEHDPRLSMSVNVSAVQFKGDKLIDVVEGVLQRTGIDPSSLKLELTETAVMADPEHALAVLARLKALGVRVSLDDFGTGYSSLSYLRRLPIDTLKIDRSFVSKLDCHDDKRQIVEMVLMLARALGMDVVAEGVETEAERDLVRGLGSHYVQGYYYFRPLAAADATRALANQAGAPAVLG